MPERRATSALERPRARASCSATRRSGVASAQRRATSSSPAPASSRSGPGAKPGRPCSSERTAFWSDSPKVRPIAITSPTDCILVPSRATAPGSFSKAQRGILVTT